MPIYTGRNDDTWWYTNGFVGTLLSDTPIHTGVTNMFSKLKPLLQYPYMLRNLSSVCTSSDSINHPLAHATGLIPRKLFVKYRQVAPHGHVHVAKSSQPCQHVRGLLTFRCLMFVVSWTAKNGWVLGVQWGLFELSALARSLPELGCLWVDHGPFKRVAPEVWICHWSDHLDQPGHGWCWTGDGLVFSGFLRVSWQMGSAVRLMFSLMFPLFLETWLDQVLQ